MKVTTALRPLALVAALALAPGAVGAATLDVVGGTAGQVSRATGNDALLPLGFGKTLGGTYGAQVILTGKADVTFTLLGFEAGNRNTLVSGQNALVGGGGRKFSVGGLSTFVLKAVSPGLLDFEFRTWGGNLTVRNGANPDNTGPRRNAGVNFFASLAKSDALYLFFDDDGANNDDDHDDLVVRVDVAPVPVPAAGWLIFAAISGLFAVRQRRRAS